MFVFSFPALMTVTTLHQPYYCHICSSPRHLFWEVKRSSCGDAGHRRNGWGAAAHDSRYLLNPACAREDFITFCILKKCHEDLLVNPFIFYIIVKPYHNDFLRKVSVTKRIHINLHELQMYVCAGHKTAIPIGILAIYTTLEFNMDKCVLTHCRKSVKSVLSY